MILTGKNELFGKKYEKNLPVHSPPPWGGTSEKYTPLFSTCAVEENVLGTRISEQYLFQFKGSGISKAQRKVVILF